MLSYWKWYHLSIVVTMSVCFNCMHTHCNDVKTVRFVQLHRHLSVIILHRPHMSPKSYIFLIVHISNSNHMKLVSTFLVSANENDDDSGCSIVVLFFSVGNCVEHVKLILQRRYSSFFFMFFRSKFTQWSIIDFIGGVALLCFTLQWLERITSHHSRQGQTGKPFHLHRYFN